MTDDGVADLACSLAFDDTGGMAAAMDTVDHWLAERGGSKDLRRRVMVVIEELSVNAFAHGDVTGEITCTLKLTAPATELRIAYLGTEFDPGDASAVPPLSAEQSGGHGLRLAQAMATSIRHDHVSGRNLITVAFIA